MVQINFASREVNCKIVYYGPGRCGKTTNLQVVHAKAPANSKGDLVQINTETDRTLYFDFLPLDLGTVAGMRTKFHLYTVPGQVYYDATRKLVLQGADGVVFVADSNPELMKENIESLDNLAKNLSENGLDINSLPVVLQFNKRDLPNAMPVAELEKQLNRNGWPTMEAVAVNGDGVFQTLKLISQSVIKRLNREQGYDEAGKKKGVASALSPATVAAPGGSSPRLPSPIGVPTAPAVGPSPVLPSAPVVRDDKDKLNSFKQRLEELKKQQAARGAVMAKAAPAEPTRKAAAPPLTPAPKALTEKKKKGCLGKAALFCGLLCAAGAAAYVLWH